MSGNSGFQGKLDRYSGITVDTRDVNLTDSEFEDVLKVSLNEWKASHKRGIWFKVNLDKASYVPLLAKNGFDFHHAKKGYVMMTKWLPSSRSSLPNYAFTTIGAAGLVVNTDNEILLIKEKYHIHKEWKFPGGFVNPGEDFADAARREVLEETGITTKFRSVVCFRHHHKSYFGCSDLYIVCLLTPESATITKCPREIAEAKWMKLEEFKSHAEGNALSRLCVEALEECKKRGVELGFSDYFSNVTKQFQKVYHLKGVEHH